MVLADVIKRWHLTKYGPATKVYQAAKQNGIDPYQWTNKISADFKHLVNILDIYPTRFIRTTEVDHVEVVKRIWKRLWEGGDIYQGTYSGWYSIADEAFVPDHETKEIHEEGKIVRIDSRTKRIVDWIQEDNYMFRLSKYRSTLLDWLKSGIIVPETRTNDLWDYLNDGSNFADISVSRRIDVIKWGIPVPNDPQQMVYVWLDALANYLTVSGYPTLGQTPDIHVIGKDILKFHAIYWPAFLVAAGLPLPRKLVVHGHWTIEKSKISKSSGVNVDPLELIDKYGVDAVRYFLMRESRLDSDADFSQASLVQIVNNELSNQWGNLISRAFTKEFLEIATQESRSIFVPRPEVVKFVQEICKACASHYDDYNFGAGLERLQLILRKANTFFTDSQPWKLADYGKASELGQILGEIAYYCLAFSIMLGPISPKLSRRALSYLGVSPEDHLSYMDVLNNRVISQDYSLEKISICEQLVPRLQLK